MLNKKSVKSVAVIPLLLVAMTATSGCIGCEIHARAMVWIQEEGFPQEEYLYGVSYTHGEYSANVELVNHSKTYEMVVQSDHSVSREAFIEVANAMFEERGWPEPELSGEYEVFCADEI